MVSTTPMVSMPSILARVAAGPCKGRSGPWCVPSAAPVSQPRFIVRTMVVNREQASPDRPRRRPPCRSSGGDERSRHLAGSMAEHSRAISATQRTLLREIAEFDRTRAWRGDGAVSMAAWLTERCGVSTATARTWVRAAGRLESLPHLSRALGEGTLSLDAVAPLADFATPESDSELAAASPHWTVKQIRELAASHRGTNDAAAARRFEHRTFRFNDAKATVWAAFTNDDYA